MTESSGMFAVRTSASIWFVCLAWACSCLAEGFTPSGELYTKLETLKAGYEAYLLKNATTPFQENLEALNAKAITALERESDAAAQRKDLEALARLKEDMERLKKGEVLTKPNSEAPKGASAVYATYQREFARIEAALKTGKADAAGKYDTGLKQLQDHLTALKEVDAALHVKSIRDELVKTRTQGLSSLTAGQPDNSNAAKGISDFAEAWTYHLRPTGSPSGVMRFSSNGSYEIEIFGLKNPHTGKWRKSKEEPNIINISPSDAPPYLMTISGEEAVLAIPVVGDRYLKVQKSPNAQPVIQFDENMPRKWSYLIEPEGGARGSVVFTQDGKAEFTGMHKNPDTGAWEQKMTPGTWTKGKKLNQLIVTFPDYSWDVRIENGIGKMDTDMGARYLKPSS